MTRVETIGDCVLYLGDCLEILPGLEKVDSVVTDPPYDKNDTHEKHLSLVRFKKGESLRQPLAFNGISGADLAEMASDWVEKANGWVVFTCDWRHVHLVEEAGILIRFGIWRKPDGAPQFTGDRPGTGWEPVAICHRHGRKAWNGGGRHAFWEYPKAHNQSGHPTEKPVKLFEDFISDFTNAGQTVLDHFMGSGTTGVACVRLGRKFIGIEIEEKYFDIACKRIEAEERQGRLFTEPKRKAEQMGLL